MKNKIVIAGGTGFIGSYIQKEYEKMGYKVIIISRNSKKNHVQWSSKAQLIKALNNAELLINLSGKSVDCRYTIKNKWKILTSRTSTTLQLHDAIKVCKNPPKKWINSSTATIYRHAEDRPMTEENGDLGTGFSVHVARVWEATFFAQKHKNIEQIALRTAIVLGDGSAFKPLKKLARLGFGGPQGNGKQKFSWIHIHDLFRIIRNIEKSDKPKSIYNCSSPESTSNKELMSLIREKFGKKWYIPIPKYLLKIGAFFIRTETELVLKSRWVLPQKLIDEEFKFQYSKIDEALESLNH
jgi:uncharacterized protein (TIGR01777 family)